MVNLNLQIWNTFFGRNVNLQMPQRTTSTGPEVEWQVIDKAVADRPRQPSTLGPNPIIQDAQWPW